MFTHIRAKKQTDDWNEKTPFDIPSTISLRSNTQQFLSVDRRKSFYLNEELTVATIKYVKDLDKVFYKISNDILKNSWINCITLKVITSMNKVGFVEKKKNFFLPSPGNY